MNCPNCIAIFRLRADYATHLETCRPGLLDPNLTAALLARLKAAAARRAAETTLLDAA